MVAPEKLGVLEQGLQAWGLRGHVHRELHILESR